MAEIAPPARQPFTFGGVARYASAPFGRLLRIALPFALLSATVLTVLAAHCWWPVISEAVEALPETLRLQNGKLLTREKDSALLAANQFLSLQIALTRDSQEAAPVDLSLQFGPSALVANSLLGETVLAYPDSLNLTLDHATVWPWWGAWKFPLLVAFGCLSLLLLLAAWAVLAFVYTPIVLAFSTIARRQLNFRRAWQLSVAAQLAASLLMAFALTLYATGEIGLPFVTIMFLAHFVPSLLNVIIAPFFLPKLEQKAKARLTGNPFRTGKEKSKQKSQRNPFQSKTTDE